MTDQRMIDLATVIGVYAICNTGAVLVHAIDYGAVLVHAIDYGADKVLASINGEDAEWCGLTEQYMEVTGELELGFNLGKLFIPFCEVMRFYGGAN